MADDAELVGNTVAAHHVARHAGDIERLAAAVAFHDRGDFHGRRTLILHAAQAQTALQAHGDFCQHIGQFLLHQLVRGQWAAELLAVHRVLACLQIAVFGRAQRAPGDAVAGAVQASERAFQAAHVGEGVFFRAKHFIHDDFAGDAGAQADLAMDFRRRQAFPAFFQHETADRAFIVLGPDDEHVGNRAVGDPHLGAGQAVAARHLARARDHAARIGAVVRFRQAEAADEFARRQFRQVFLFRFFVAEGMDRYHHQRRLHAHHRAVARIDALDFARGQAIAHVIQAGAAVFFGYRRAQQAQLAHFAEDGGVGAAMAERFEHARHQAALAIVAGRFQHGAFVARQLFFQQQGGIPVEYGFAHHRPRR